MNKKKIFVLVGHPDTDSMSGRLALAYEEGAKQAGHEVRRINIGELQFDPILHKGYKVIQELEPDLRIVQEYFKWADHVALFYPQWWGSMPALLKGMFDRMFLPGFAFKFHKDSLWWDKLLTGKSARVVVTMDQYPLLSRLMWGDTTNEICAAALGFSGISPVRCTKLGPVKKADDKKRAAWAEKMKRLGANGK